MTGGTHSPFPLLETERLVLRKLVETDNAAILFLRSDERVNQYIKRPRQKTLEDATTYIAKISKGILHNESIMWAITIKSTSKLIGTVCLWNFSSDKKMAELGYELHPDFQRQGLMTETIRKVIDYAFKELTIELIEAFTNRNNAPSIKLLSKNGFRLEPERVDEGNLANAIYSLTKPKQA